MSTAIRFTGVSKRYRLFKQRPFLARELFRALLQRPSDVMEHWALSDVSFEIEKGESVGIVGTNGAGKSTLLALVARTSYPTSGTVEVEGSVGPMLELGAGFHPDLTGRENVYLNAALLGLMREQIHEKFDAIAAYAGIGDFMDAPINTYSTGMKARLGFAVVAHVDPDILLLDEVLAVGDLQFQAKCHKTIQSFKQAGKTLFFVSHSLEPVRELCARAIWLEQGRLRQFGPTEEVTARYQESLMQGA